MFVVKLDEENGKIQNLKCRYYNSYQFFFKSHVKECLLMSYNDVLAPLNKVLKTNN